MLIMRYLKIFHCPNFYFFQKFKLCPQKLLVKGPDTHRLHFELTVSAINTKKCPTLALKVKSKKSRIPCQESGNKKRNKIRDKNKCKSKYNLEMKSSKKKKICADLLCKHKKDKARRQGECSKKSKSLFRENSRKKSSRLQMKQKRKDQLSWCSSEE